MVMTHTGGATWSDLAVPQKLANTLPNVDLRAIETQGNYVWLAGNPGNKIFRFDLKKRKLEIFDIPFRGQINDIEFVNENLGWIAGELGAIFATNNGGKTWRRQRGRHSRVALLVVAEDRTQLPLELLAKYAGEDGYLAACLIGRQPEDHDQFPIHEALERLGCNCLQTTPSSRLTPARIAQAIRTWQPSVVVINGSIPFTEVATRALALGRKDGTGPLDVWTPDRVAIPSPNGPCRVTAQQVLPNSGKTAGDHVVISRAMISTPTQPMELWPSEPGFELQALSSIGRGTSTQLLDGLDIAGPLPRRPKQRHSTTNLGMIQLLSQKQETLRHLQRWTNNAGSRLQSWRNEVAQITNPLPAEAAGLWLFELADEYMRNGKPGLAGDTIEFLARRYPDHVFAAQAKSWLVHFYSSLELATATQSDFAQTHVEKASANLQLTVPREVIEDGQKKVKWVRQSKDELENAKQALLTNDVSLSEWFKLRCRKASLMLERAQSENPILSLDNGWKFSEAKLIEIHQPDFPPENLYRQISSATGVTDLLAEAASRESRLIKMKRTSTGGDSEPASAEFQPLLAAPAPPHLDGLFDEDAWNSGGFRAGLIERLVPLDRLDLPTSRVALDQARFRYDEQFFYAGFLIQKIKGQSYTPQEGKRIRDPNLEKQDRIVLELDVDRDYRSSFRFVIDSKGRAAEDCAGCVGWNPSWYVAAKQEKNHWSVELAIPLDELGIEWSQVQENGGLADRMLAIRCVRMDYDSRILWSLATPNGASDGSQPIQSGGFSVREHLFYRCEFRPQDYLIFVAQ